MKKKYYKKAKRKNTRKIVRFVGLGIAILGFGFGLYIFFPLLSWEIYLKPVFASQQFASPIPGTSIVSSRSLKSLFANSFHGIDDSNAENWLPKIRNAGKRPTQISSYFLSIPKLNIGEAIVTTVDTDLTHHLVHFPGTALPGTNGTAVIFGHSTLPQLFDPRNYKTIFANVHNLSLGNMIYVSVKNREYIYKIFNISISDADDTSYLTQSYDDSYLTIVTCTPPGTTWKRLIIKAELAKI